MSKLDPTAPLDASQKTEPLGRVEKTEPLPRVERTHHMDPADIARAIAGEDDAAPRSSRSPMWPLLAACLVVGLLLGGGAMLLVQSLAEDDVEVPRGVHAAEGTATADRPHVAQAASPARSDAPLLEEGADSPALEAEATPGDEEDVEGTDTDGRTTARRATQRGQGQSGTVRDRGGEGGLAASEGGLGGLRAAQGGAGQEQQEGERTVHRVIRGRINVEGLDDESGAGVFDSNLVVRQLRLRQSTIQRCYERELRHNPRLAGRVVARFSIQPGGTVSGATATENSSGSPAVATCVLNVVRGLRFNPGPEGGPVTYSFPFVFAPQN